MNLIGMLNQAYNNVFHGAEHVAGTAAHNVVGNYSNALHAVLGGPRQAPQPVTRPNFNAPTMGQALHPAQIRNDIGDAPNSPLQRVRVAPLQHAMPLHPLQSNTLLNEGGWDSQTPIHSGIVNPLIQHMIDHGMLPPSPFGHPTYLPTKVRKSTPMPVTKI